MNRKEKFKLNRFTNPGTLTSDTKILGVTVREWDEAFTGRFENGLAVQKTQRQIQESDSLPTNAKE